MLTAMRWLARCALGAALAASATAAEPAALQSFRASYELRYSALRADATMVLQPAVTAGEYIYTISTKTRGVARLVRPGTATEVARFTYNRNGFRPLTYKLNDGSESDDNDSAIQFDWQTGVAQCTHENESAQLQISAGMLDRLTADIAAIQTLRDKKTLTEFAVVDRNEIRKIGYVYQGEETIKVPAGTFRTMKYLRQRPDSTRATQLWFAPEAAYLPAKIVQLKRGKPVVEMLATALEPAPARP